MSDLECPYCGAENNICHDDGFGYEEDVAHEMECGWCEKSFTFQTHISYNYYPQKAECLNTGVHQLGDWITLWRHEGKTSERRHCATCDYIERRIRSTQEE